MIKQVTKHDPKINICFVPKGTCPTNPGTHFLGKKKSLRQNCWGYGPFNKDMKMDGIVLFHWWLRSPNEPKYPFQVLLKRTIPPTALPQAFFVLQKMGPWICWTCTLWQKHTFCVKTSKNLQKYTKHVLLSKGTCPTNPGAYFLGKPKAPAARLLGVWSF